MQTTIIVLFIAGLITGFSKFSVGGMGLIVLPVLLIAFPGPEALGMILPVYIATDLFAVLSYRERIRWSVLLQLLPVAIIGILIGRYFLVRLNTDQFVDILGIIILAMLALGVFLDSRPAAFMRNRLVAYAIGILGGLVGALANAAGPLFSLYLLERKLDKITYVSTRAWIFFVFNLLKLPLYLSLGYLTTSSVATSMIALPGLIVGSMIGYQFLQRVNPATFKWIIRGISLVSAGNLLFVRV